MAAGGGLQPAAAVWWRCCRWAGLKAHALELLALLLPLPIIALRTAGVKRSLLCPSSAVSADTRIGVGRRLLAAAVVLENEFGAAQVRRAARPDRGFLTAAAWR